MIVADLIAELEKLPPHLPVFAALDWDGYEATDIEGEPVCLNLTPDCDCLGVSRLKFEGTYVAIIGDGMVPDAWNT